MNGYPESSPAAAGPPPKRVKAPRKPERYPLWFASVLSLLGGGLIVLSVPRMNWEPLGFLGLLPLFIAVEGASYRRVFWCAWLFGLVTNIGGFPWITELLIRFGNLHVGVALVLHLLLGAFQALMFPVAALGATWLRRTRLPFVPSWIAGFLLADYFFPMIFPWYLAMSQHRFAIFIQIADLVGVVGVTSLLVAVNAGVYLGLMFLADRSAARPALGAVQKQTCRTEDAEAPGPQDARPRCSAATPQGARRRGPGCSGGRMQRLFLYGDLLPRGLFARTEVVWTTAAIGAALVAALVYGYVLQERYREIRARSEKVPFGLVQPNIGIFQKRDPSFAWDNLERQQRMTAEVEARGALVAVWPEASYPYGLPHDPPPEGKPLRDRREGDAMRIRRGFTIPLVLGSISRGTQPPRRYNSAFVLDSEGVLHGPVDKNVLLMFGEYIPLRDQLGFLDRWFPRAGSLAAGSKPGLLPLGSLTLGILNCYEDILPGYVGRLMRAGAPNVLVNITNDAWFGDSSEPYQHLSLAVFRSVEQRREMVRAVNTGVSAHIAATGEILWQSSIFVPATHVADVVPYAGRTVYSLVGDMPGYAVLTALIGWAGWRRFRRRRTAGACRAEDSPGRQT